MAPKLIALPPFTDELSEEDKKDVKKQFAEKLFVGDDPQESAEPSLTGSQISLVSQVLENGQEMEELVSLAETLASTDRVRFFGGVFPTY